MKRKYAVVFAGVMVLSMFSGCAMENGKFVATANAGERANVVQNEGAQKEDGGLIGAIKLLGATTGDSGQTNSGAAQGNSGTQGSRAGENTGEGSSSSQTNTTSASQSGSVTTEDNQNTELQGNGTLDVNAFAAELLQDFTYGTGWGAGSSGATLKAYGAAISFMTTANNYGVCTADNTQLANACVNAYASLGEEERQLFASNWSTIVAAGDSVLDTPGDVQGELEDSGALAAAQKIICTEGSPQNWAVLKSLIQVNCIG